ncbi:hypothetical protein Tco_0972973 [Tanacetum coccineum]
MLTPPPRSPPITPPTISTHRAAQQHHPLIIDIIISSGRVFVSLGLHGNKGVYGFVISTKEGALGLKPPQHHLSRGSREGVFAVSAHQGAWVWQPSPSTWMVCITAPKGGLVIIRGAYWFWDYSAKGWSRWLRTAMQGGVASGWRFTAGVFVRYVNSRLVVWLVMYNNPAGGVRRVVGSQPQGCVGLWVNGEGESSLFVGLG